ncbi:MAG: mycofactocin biosynthesis glycosyltransferase MftF [Actinomycetota bacterium]|nr:mycofactocin biosynthesis glycosyltransferase MftF [Actinomycetota bacterium]
MPAASAGEGGPGLPAGWGLRLDRHTVRPRAAILIGGFPVRALRLSDGGSRLIDTWSAGGVVSPRVGARRLARRLTDGGVAHPLPHPTGDDPHLTVTTVIPVRDRVAGLAVTLGGMTDDTDVVVVDDGSTDAAALQAAADLRPGPTTVLRHPQSRGPGAARNTGWRQADGDLVAFVDADVELPASWLTGLVPHFADPTVAAVAPRVVAVAGSCCPAWLAAYEAVRSPLDLGDQPAPVRPRSRVSYVPTTALVVRRRALADLGGFDEAMRTGEDVDLIWRLAEAGWRVRYQPDMVVAHPSRQRLGAWVGQRIDYGRSAAPLYAHHGPAVAPLVISAEAAAVGAAALFAHPVIALAIAATAVGRVTARLGRHTPRGALTRLAVLAQGRAMAASAEAARRVWWPLAVATAVVSPRSRPALLTAFVFPALLSWVRNRPAVDLLRWSLLYVADDVAYGIGVWAGVARTGEVGALRPVINYRARGGSAR